MPVTVAVDANGADMGAAEVAAGAALAAVEGVNVLLFGPAAQMGAPGPGVEVRDTPLSVAKDPDPARAVRSNPEASVVQAAGAVASGQADALVAGGSTGAVLAAGLFEIKRAPGIYRPALAIPVPVPDHPVTLLDVGANAEVRSEHLVQFAYMGAAFSTAVLGVERPRVALLSNGEEAARGTPEVVAAHEQLAAGAGLDFVGNVEGTDITSGVADVVVTDGFTGNIAIKLSEGVSATMIAAIRTRVESSLRSKLGGLLIRPALRGLRDELDPETSGGAYLLGLRGTVVVPHGRFTRRGYANAILLAARAVEGEMAQRTHAALEAAGALRRRVTA
ncbi:MAG: phosphate acyltransferase PlsX [Solirubrobacteraceae bacterium]|nr:phosphate acyltransferase PlsX [Solirubrobacteraceae bacterium]